MSLLLSNYQPAKFQTSTFDEIFNKLIHDTERLDIAIGYVSVKSLDYLADFIYKKGKPVCNLIIGMHYFERFTYAQYVAAKQLETILKDNNLGGVKLVTSFPYHGKVYSFKLNQGQVKTVVGSSNLNNILPHKGTRQYELDILIEDQSLTYDIDEFLKKLNAISPQLSSDELKIDSFKTTNNLMEGLSAVTSIDSEKYITEVKKDLKYSDAIKIPIKSFEDAPKSNINAFFGKGRENKSTHIIRKRPWYEVELIVPKNITSLGLYPKPIHPSKECVITVLTDDGYQFKCKISGTNNKNFRSEGDLKILGKWLKGRLENAGLLLPEQAVTKSILEQYGRDYITFTPTSDSNLWFLDFSSNIKEKG